MSVREKLSPSTSKTKKHIERERGREGSTTHEGKATHVNQSRGKARGTVSERLSVRARASEPELVRVRVREINTKISRKSNVRVKAREGRRVVCARVTIRTSVYV